MKDNLSTCLLLYTVDEYQFISGVINWAIYGLGRVWDVNWCLYRGLNSFYILFRSVSIQYNID